VHNEELRAFYFSPDVLLIT